MSALDTVLVTLAAVRVVGALALLYVAVILRRLIVRSVPALTTGSPDAHEVRVFASKPSQSAMSR